MTEVMTPSKTMSNEQIERAVEIFRAKLRKHQDELPLDVVQQVFGQSELGQEWFDVLRKRVEALSNLIVRKVEKIDRTRQPEDVLKETGRAVYTDKKVVATMPRGEGDGAEIVFFKPDLSQRDGVISCTDLMKEYDLRGLIPVDVYSLADHNKADPAFADEKPHGTQWVDEAGKFCYATFDRYGDGRRVLVRRGDDGWSDGWWFAGLRKSAVV